jgi:hypothetical protein
VVRIAKPQRVKTEYTFKNDPAPAIAVASPNLQRTEPDPVIPDLKKPDNSLARTETPVINPGNTSVTAAAPNLQRTEPDPIIPDLKKPDNTMARTETKEIDAAPVTLKPSASGKTAVMNKPVLAAGEKTTAAVEKDVTKTINPSVVKQQEAVKPAENNVAKTTPQAKRGQAENNNKPVASNTVSKTNPPVNNNEIKKPETNSVAQKTNTTVAVTPSAAPVVNAPKKSIDELTKDVTTIAGRKSEFSQVVDFKSDSLVLSLYDNGEIDGDTVSVIMNGEVIMAKQGLKASAIKKTIYIGPGQQEDFTLVLFADNLGKYPPNTGLLVVHDGEDIYHLRFSSDFQKSSGIVFRKKK